MPAEEGGEDLRTQQQVWWELGSSSSFVREIFQDRGVPHHNAALLPDRRGVWDPDVTIAQNGHPC